MLPGHRPSSLLPEYLHLLTTPQEHPLAFDQSLISSHRDYNMIQYTKTDSLPGLVERLYECDRRLLRWLLDE